MIRLGARCQSMHPMAADEIFLSRLELLTIMVKAYLKGYPLGDFRIKAIRENAQFLFYQALYRSSQMVAAHTESSKPMEDPDNHMFLQRVQLLSVMAKSFVQEDDMGSFRKKAIADNLAFVCDHLSNLCRLADAQFLKVA